MQSPDITLNELVNEALLHWVEMTGVVLGKSSYSISSRRFNEYELSKVTQDLNESRTLDETGLTTWMMLRALTEAWKGELVCEDTNIIYSQIQHRFYGGKSEKDYAGISPLAGDVSINQFTSLNGGGYYCYDRPEYTASITTLFSPNCPGGLAALLGISVDQLPWQLRNWHRGGLDPYSGNHILDRCDPIDWVLKNPWSALSFRVGIAFSKRGFNARRKALGLPPKSIDPQLKSWGI